MLLIGIAGPSGSGKGVAADFLAQHIPGAVVMTTEELAEDLSRGVHSRTEAPVTIIPDVADELGAEVVRRHGHMVIMTGRNPNNEGATVPLGDRDWLIANNRGMPELYERLTELAIVVRRRLAA